MTTLGQVQTGVKLLVGWMQRLGNIPAWEEMFYHEDTEEEDGRKRRRKRTRSMLSTSLISSIRTTISPAHRKAKPQPRGFSSAGG